MALGGERKAGAPVGDRTLSPSCPPCCPAFPHLGPLLLTLAPAPLLLLALNGAVPRAWPSIRCPPGEDPESWPWLLLGGLITTASPLMQPGHPGSRCFLPDTSPWKPPNLTLTPSYLPSPSPSHSVGSGPLHRASQPVPSLCTPLEAAPLPPLPSAFIGRIYGTFLPSPL